nr:YlmH/Sll1252 family protein [Maliibacterium massiliense]
MAPVREQTAFMAMARDAARRAARSGRAQYTTFLDEEQAAWAATAAAKEGVGAFPFGGYDDAERCMVCCADAPPAPEDYPMARLCVSWPEAAGLSHRDMLGALLGLGIERVQVGDIVLHSHSCDVFVTDTMADYITRQLLRVGRAHVSVRRADAPFVPPERRYTLHRGTVASLRLDAALSVALPLSREKCAQLIASGGVRLNHCETLRADARLQQGDTLSLRGFGRYDILEVGSLTRKGRTHIVVGQRV